MDRRELVGLLAGAALGAGVPGGRTRADTDRSTEFPTAGPDLRGPLRLAIRCVVDRMDAAAGYRPWFAIDVRDGVPHALRHDVWDHGDMSGRFLEALILARGILGACAERQLAEARIRTYLVSLLGPAGPVVNPDLGRHDHPFSQGSALYGLVADFQDSGAPEARRRVEALIRGLDALSRHQDDYLVFDELATPAAPCSQHAAYQVLPVVRFHELTGDTRALDYAGRLSRWACYHDPTVTADGVITLPGWEGHLHAWMDTFSGILRWARASADPDRPAIVARSRRLFDWVLARQTTPYGWVADSVGSSTCETCTISSAIRLALELIAEGHEDYWNVVERFTRNQLLQNQFRDPGALGIADAGVERGLRGAFESYAAPNTLLANRDGTVEGCCINGGIRGLALAWQNAIRETRDSVHVNLLLSRATSGIEVVSYLPREGRIDIRARSSKRIVLRCPDWVSPDELALDAPAGVRRSVPAASHALAITGARAGTRITIHFSQRRLVEQSLVAGRRYEVSWRGDTVTGLTPAGRPYPLYGPAVGPDSAIG